MVLNSAYLLAHKRINYGLTLTVYYSGGFFPVNFVTLLDNAENIHHHTASNNRFTHDFGFDRG